MNPGELVCWKCGTALKEQPLPLGRRAECLACRAELHVCRMCRHFTPGKAKQCMEPMAEEVKDKTRANFCDWFQPGCSGPPAAAGNPDRAALATLFGESPDAPAKAIGGSRNPLDDLFGA